MATGDKIVIALAALFLAGIAGGVFGSSAWLLLCLPLLVTSGLFATCAWLANRHFKGLKLW